MVGVILLFIIKVLGYSSRQRNKISRRSVLRISLRMSFEKRVIQSPYIINIFSFS